VETILLSTEDSLVRAFDPPRGVTALVGGGGKTTLMLRLASELSQKGARVIVTTTTHIFPPDGIPTLNPASPEEARAALLREPLVCLGKPAEDGKLCSPDLPIGEMERLADYIFVEADGAKQLPLKAPAAHEPVIPPETRLVVAVAGLDGAGRPIRDAAFRPALYAALCEKTEEDAVCARDIARVLAHPEGQRKSVTEDMCFAVLLNKADDDARRRTALAVAAELERYAPERAVIAALGGERT